jgi:hypothetical protein
METIEMRHDIPEWAKQQVALERVDFFAIQRLHRQGRVQIQLPDLKRLKSWAKSRGWPAPWFDFRYAFVAKMFENEGNFTLALTENKIIIHIPIKEHILSVEALKALDKLYEEREDMGVLGQRPVHWGTLVSKLREIRHLVEGGVNVRIEGTQTTLNSWQRFYDWAHGRYHMLEDGYDSWIGDDRS